MAIARRVMWLLFYILFWKMGVNSCPTRCRCEFVFLVAAGRWAHFTSIKKRKEKAPDCTWALTSIKMADAQSRNSRAENEAANCSKAAEDLNYLVWKKQSFEGVSKNPTIANTAKPQPTTSGQPMCLGSTFCERWCRPSLSIVTATDLIEKQGIKKSPLKKVIYWMTFK